MSNRVLLVCSSWKNWSWFIISHVVSTDIVEGIAYFFTVMSVLDLYIAFVLGVRGGILALSVMFEVKQLLF